MVINASQSYFNVCFKCDIPLLLAWMVTLPPLQPSKAVFLILFVNFPIDRLTFLDIYWKSAVFGVWLSVFFLRQKSRRDVGNFDKEFTKMAVELTPTDKLFIMNLDQNEFQGFSYTNPEFIIQVWGVHQRTGSAPPPLPLRSWTLTQYPITHARTVSGVSSI